MKKQLLLKILNILFSFLLSIFTFYFIVSVVLNFTVLNRAYLNHVLDESFFNGYYSELVVKLNSLSPASGVEESFFTGVIDKQTFEADTRSFVTSCLDGGDTALLQEQIGERISADVNSKLAVYTKNAGYELTSEVTAALSHLSDVCASYYKDVTAGKMTAYTLTTAGSLSARFKKIALPAASASFVMMLFCAGYLIYLNRKDTKVLLKTASSSILATSLMLIAIPLTVFFSGVLKRLGIMSEAVKAAISNYAGGILILLLIMGLILAGVVVAAAVYINKKYRKNS